MNAKQFYLRMFLKSPYSLNGTIKGGKNVIKIFMNNFLMANMSKFYFREVHMLVTTIPRTLMDFILSIKKAFNINVLLIGYGKHRGNIKIRDLAVRHIKFKYDFYSVYMCNFELLIVFYECNVRGLKELTYMICVSTRWWRRKLIFLWIFKIFLICAKLFPAFYDAQMSKLWIKIEFTIKFESF